MNTHHISGTFSVSMLPQPTDNPLLGRMLLDKQYQGELQARGQGQMLSAGTSTPGSAGYVAIELVSGSLQGREGSFVLQHHGVMNRGTPQLGITVVPDSGTGALLGLAGTMNIRIAEGRHFYDFDYTLA